MPLILTADQQVRFTVSYKDRYGNTATIDDAPVWFSSDPTLLTMTPDADGLSCLVATVGPTGTAQVVVRADGDLGDGTREIIGLEDVEIIGGEALMATMSAGTVEPKPETQQPDPVEPSAAPPTP